jgi:hypothetical protein
VDVEADKYTILGLVDAVVDLFAAGDVVEKGG